MAVDLHLVDLALLGCSHEGAVVDFLYTALYKRRKKKQVKSQQQYKYGRVKDNERFLRTFDFVQDSLPFFSVSQDACASPKPGLLLLRYMIAFHIVNKQDKPNINCGGEFGVL
jgi:hypothetical protein